MPRRTIYVVEVPEKALFGGATDMLRHDLCYSASYDEASKSFRLYCMLYTPARWESFNVHPKLVDEVVVPERVYNEHITESNGFVRALRFLQELRSKERPGEGWNGRYVEGGLIHGSYFPNQVVSGGD